jgi:protein O-GlcNAc transferase
MTNNRNILILKQQLHILIQSKRLEEAKRVAQHILYSAPKDSDANLFLAQLCESKSEIVRAVEYYWAASQATVPSETRNLILEKTVDLCNSKSLFKHGLKPAKALVQARPEYSKAVFFYGLFLHKANFFPKAIEYLSSAHEKAPSNVWCLNYLALSYAYSGRADEAMYYFDKCEELNSDEYRESTFRIYAYNCIFKVNERESYLAHQVFGARLEEPFTEKVINRQKSRGKKLRIGYISADFYWHSVSYFFRAALFGKARKNFEIYCYSDTDKSDGMTEELLAASDVWRESRALSDQQLCNQIIADKVDILVDLSGYASRNRMAVFARRAAPIQVTYLGYPNTTGLSRMDYRLTDDQCDPEGTTEQFHTEELLRLPGGFLCYYPNVCAPIVAPLPASHNGGQVCFGSFNTFQKIGPELLAAWAKILKQVENSKLLIKAGPLHDAEFCAWVRQHFEQVGVDPLRVELIGWTKDKAEHLTLYSKIDIHLDTFPYNGTTTTCEALWQGVPTLTLCGDVHRARVGYSILSQLGMEDYVAHNIEGYIAKAVEKANDIENLSTLRSQLRERMQKSDLMDIECFSDKLADVYTKIHFKAS